MTMSPKRWLVVTLSAAAAAASLAGITYADIGGTTIYGCYKIENGQLRVIDIATETCLSSETLISWNQTGPQGPQGIQGEPGPVGPRGPSDAHDVYRVPGNNIAITGTSLAAATRVLEYDLPAGKFAITSKVNVSSSGSGGGLVHCYTKTLSGWFDMGVSSIGPNAGETLEATLSTTFTANEVNPGPLSVDCWRINGVGGPPLAGLAEAVAIQVETIHIVGI